MMLKDEFKNKRIAVIGDIMLDEYYDCDVDRISPEAPIPIIKTTKGRRTYGLGGSSNVALNLDALGITTHLFGYIGNDEAGDIIISKLASKVIVNFLAKSLKPTIRKIRFRNEQQQNLKIMMQL